MPGGGPQFAQASAAAAHQRMRARRQRSRPAVPVDDTQRRGQADQRHLRLFQRRPCRAGLPAQPPRRAPHRPGRQLAFTPRPADPALGGGGNRGVHPGQWLLRHAAPLLPAGSGRDLFHHRPKSAVLDPLPDLFRGPSLSLDLSVRRPCGRPTTSVTTARLRLFGIVVSVWLAPPCLAQTAEEDSVAHRPRPDFDADGIMIPDTDLLLFPTAQTSAITDSNALKTDENHHGDFAARLVAGLGLRSDEETHGWSLSADGDSTRYLRFSSQNGDQARVKQSGFVTPTEDTRIDLDLSEQWLVEPIQDSGS